MIAPFVTLNHVSEINSLCLFVNLITVPVCLFLTDLFRHFLLTSSFTNHFFLFWLTTLLKLPPLSLSLPAENLSVLQIISPEVLFLAPGSRTITRTGFFLSYPVFVFRFFVFFWFLVPCGRRLDWSFRRLLNARKYITISYLVITYNDHCYYTPTVNDCPLSHKFGRLWFFDSTTLLNV